MKMENENWEQELFDFINEKAQEHKDVPRYGYRYFNLLAQLARHEAEHIKHAGRIQHNKPIDCIINKELQGETK